MNETAERWLAFALEDLRGAEAMLREGLHNLVCFHAQQCVEKSLKGALAEYGQVPPRTHSITDLLNMFPSTWLANLKSSLVKLDDFYIPTRYPDALPGMLPTGLPGKVEAEEMLALARSVLGWIQTDVGADIEIAGRSMTQDQSR